MTTIQISDDAWGWTIMVIVGAGLAFFMGCFAGCERTTYELRTDAVKHGAGQYEADETGRPRFTWTTGGKK